MSSQSGYKKQKNLSAVQLLAEVPTFMETLLSAIFSSALLLYVDLMDSLSYMLRNIMVMLLSKKLSKDLRFEYNYGVEKIEAISSLVCDGIVLFGMLLTFCLSIYSFFYPSRPSDLLLAVAGLKLYDIMWDVAFFAKQRKIYKTQRTAMIEANYAAAFGAMLFDILAFLSLFAMWLFRDNPIGAYISPIASIGAVIYLSIGCIKRIRVSLRELTDKTLPEQTQMQILKVVTRYFDSYEQIYSIDSRKSGALTRIEIRLAFESDTSVTEVLALQSQLQEEFTQEIGDCVLRLLMQDEKEQNRTAHVPPTKEVIQ